MRSHDEPHWLGVYPNLGARRTNTVRLLLQPETDPAVAQIVLVLGEYGFRLHQEDPPGLDLPSARAALPCHTAMPNGSPAARFTKFSADEQGSEHARS